MFAHSWKHWPTSVSRWDKKDKDYWANLNSLNMDARRTDKSPVGKLGSVHSFADVIVRPSFLPRCPTRRSLRCGTASRWR